MARIKNLVIILPAIGMIVSICVAIYLTPLYQYENIFQNTNLLIPNFFGSIMLGASYYVNYKLLSIGTKGTS